jgi:hypothetical protein
MTDNMTYQNIDLSSSDTLYMELLVKPEVFNVVYIWTYVWQR